MKQEDEQGFLASKFDDWSGEPIPNGWNSLESKIAGRRRVRNGLLLALPALILLSIFFRQNPDRQQQGAAETKGLGIRHSSTVALNPGKNEIAALRKAKNASVESLKSIPEASFQHSSNQNFSGNLISHAIKEVSTSAFDGSSLGREATSSFQSKEILPVETGIFSGSEKPSTASLDLASLELRVPVFQLNEPEKLSLHMAAGFSTPPVQNRFSSFNKSIQFQAGYLMSSVEINPAQNEHWRYRVKSPNFSQAAFASAGLRLEKPIKGNFTLFYQMDAGVLMRQMNLESTSKTPFSYSLISNGDSRFSVSPELSVHQEVRNSLMVFAKTEIGVRQAVGRRTGVLAAAQLWGRLGSKAWSSLSDGAGFSAPSSALASAYRLGFWMQTGPFSQAEFSFGSVPEHIAPATKGMAFRSNAFSLSLRQSF